MADPVNLRRARKEKARRETQAQAEQNRFKFGRAKSERAATAIESARNANRLDGHRLDDGPHPRDD